MIYDIVLKKKPYVEGLTREDYDYKNSGLKDFVKVAMECGGTDFNFNGVKVCVLK